MNTIFHGTAAERDTILAALGYFKANFKQIPASLWPSEIVPQEEFDRLCERLSAPVAEPNERALNAAKAASELLAAGPTSFARLAEVIAREMLPQVPEPVNAELLNALVNADHLLRALIANHDIRLTDLGQGILAKIDQEKARAESALAAQKPTAG